MKNPRIARVFGTNEKRDQVAAFFFAGAAFFAAGFAAGVAAFYTPVDHGFPPNGILASGKPHAPIWVYADLDLDALQRVRAEGPVFNYREWDGQLRHVRPPKA